MPRSPFLPPLALAAALPAPARAQSTERPIERMAENIKCEIGSAWPLDEELTMTMRGRSLLSGLPQSVEVSSIEIREAIAGPVQAIIDVTKDTLDETPPELVADINNHL